MLEYLHILLRARVAAQSERGASAVEYGLLITGIAAVIVLSVFAFGGAVNNLFGDTCKNFANHASQGTC